MPSFTPSHERNAAVKKISAIIFHTLFFLIFLFSFFTPKKEKKSPKRRKQKQKRNSWKRLPPKKTLKSKIENLKKKSHKSRKGREPKKAQQIEEKPQIYQASNNNKKRRESLQLSNQDPQLPAFMYRKGERIVSNIMSISALLKPMTFRTTRNTSGCTHRMRYYTTPWDLLHSLLTTINTIYIVFCVRYFYTAVSYY